MLKAQEMVMIEVCMYIENGRRERERMKERVGQRECRCKSTQEMFMDEVYKCMAMVVVSRRSLREKENRLESGRRKVVE